MCIERLACTQRRNAAAYCEVMASDRDSRRRLGHHTFPALMTPVLSEASSCSFSSAISSCSSSTSSFVFPMLSCRQQLVRLVQYVEISAT